MYFTKMLRRNEVRKLTQLCHYKPSYTTPNLGLRKSFISMWPAANTKDWNKAVSEAEKIVGYPTSFMSLRCLLSDELSNVALQMRKLVGTKHPLLKTARKYFFDGKHSMQSRGLLVLLISKAINNTHNSSINSENLSSGIHQNQRSLAEITEMIYTASLIHKGVVNLSTVTNNEVNDKDMQFGNKMAVLSGDFLLANASTGLAELRNSQVLEIISSAIGDLMEAEFLITQNANGQNVLPPEGVTLKEWEQYVFLSEGSLLAKSCKCAMILGNENEKSQYNAFEFGKFITFAKQAREDILPFTKLLEDNGNSVTVTSLPVVVHLKKTDSMSTSEINNLQSHDIIQLVQNSSVEEAISICKTYGQKALRSLTHITDSEPKTALKNIVTALMTF